MTNPVRDSEIRTVQKAKRVLVVDDHVDSAELLEFLLRQSGHEVVTAFNVEAAFEQALEFLPHVALLDIGMPGESGYQLAARLRGEPSLGECRFIAVTGHAHESHRRLSENAGFFRHLVKPLDTTLLLEAVEADDERPSCAPVRGWSAQ